MTNDELEAIRDDTTRLAKYRAAAVLLLNPKYEYTPAEMSIVISQEHVHVPLRKLRGEGLIDGRDGILKYRDNRGAHTIRYRANFRTETLFYTPPTEEPRPKPVIVYNSRKASTNPGECIKCGKDTGWRSVGSKCWRCLKQHTNPFLARDAQEILVEGGTE